MNTALDWFVYFLALHGHRRHAYVALLVSLASALSSPRPAWWEALPESDWPSVDLLVRSHSGETSQLLLLLRSIEMYWPLGRWGVVVILDDDPWDAALALSLPSFVRVVIEPAPPRWDDFVAVRRKMEGVESKVSSREAFDTWHLAKGSRGYVRAQWSQLIADRHSDAEFLAWIDTDCVLFTYVTPTVLFDKRPDGAADSEGPFVLNAVADPDGAGASKLRRFWGVAGREAYLGLGNLSVDRGDGAPMPRWRPVVNCGDDPPAYFPVIRVLGWPWVCEFMIGFPFVVHRDVVPLARGLIVKTYRKSFLKKRVWSCRKTWDHGCQMTLRRMRRPNDDEFAEAFNWLSRATKEGFGHHMRDGALLPCATSIIGHVAYLYMPELHAFSAHHQVVTNENWLRVKVAFPIRVGPEGIPLEARCPSLRGAIHLGYWSEYDKHMSPREYFKFGVHLLLMGRCGERSWRKDQLVDASEGCSSLGRDNATVAARAQALCGAIYCADCPTLEWTLSMAHDSYKLSWFHINSAEGCPRRRWMKTLLDTYQTEWNAVVEYLVRDAATRTEAADVGELRDGGGSPSCIAFADSVERISPNLRLQHPGGYAGLLIPTIHGF
eukprot:TRINITY_DN16147_c0_g1_i1.p1 TRINITY_DN16147_c0_g1~~TRINITY_DN16147_c0_g1_i1.p1  ORF type:complete len:607 (+),score=78.30 TRINITY_DN16147_c0_g1_i1:181-2001(+)